MCTVPPSSTEHNAGRTVFLGGSSLGKVADENGHMIPKNFGDQAPYLTYDALSTSTFLGTREDCGLPAHIVKEIRRGWPVLPIRRPTARSGYGEIYSAVAGEAQTMRISAAESKWFTEDQAFSLWHYFVLPPPSSARKLSLFPSLPEYRAVAGRASWLVRGGAKSYDGEKARPSVNHAKLSDAPPTNFVKVTLDLDFLDLTWTWT